MSRVSTPEQWEFADQVLDYLENDGKISKQEKKNLKLKLNSHHDDYYAFESLLHKLQELANI